MKNLIINWSTITPDNDNYKKLNKDHKQTIFKFPKTKNTTRRIFFLIIYHSKLIDHEMPPGVYGF